MNVCIRELPADLRPTNRLQYAGAAAVSSAELIAVLIGSGTQQENAIRLAEALLCEFDGIHGLARAPLEELCQMDGIGPTKAARILAALELGKRGLSTGFE
jgi:DNA repair protein RadC